ncbi:MAG: hypothetical protein LBU43_13115 [Candidatus Accumulibacter sp.]|jgi:hypothetical protein|nr:hypothetical protein [Accumulibacter sp.]
MFESINKTQLASLLLVLAAAFGLGWTLNGWRLQSALATVEKQHAEAVAAAQQAVTDATEKTLAIERQGEIIAARAIAAENQNTQLAKERDHAIRKLSTGRACLSAPVVRLLNAGAAPGRSGLSATPGVATLAAPGIAADSADQDDYANDIDVALWSRNARSQYNVCRERIDALRAFFVLSNGREE